MNTSFRLLILIFCLAHFQLKAQRTNEAAATVSEAHNLYLRTDKDFYLAGEIIWFKCHLADEAFKPIEAKQRILIELVNDDKSVVQQQVLSSNGSADGSLYLPLFLKQGHYQLRAYLPKDVNEAQHFFTKTLPLANTFEKQTPESPATRQWRARVFSEANTLVKGLESKIAVMLRDVNGTPLDFSAWLVKGRDSLKQFHSHKFGLASTSFTPDSTLGYQLWVTANDSSIQLEVPPIAESGVVISATPNNSGYEIQLSMDSSHLPSSYMVQLHQREALLKSRKVNLNTGQGSVAFTWSDLPEGISRLTVFNDDQEVIGERLLFRKPQEELPLSLTTSSESFGYRQAVDLGIEAPQGSDLSVSVYHLDDIQQKPSSSIRSYWWLQEELRGHIHQADYYFGEPTEERRRAIENLLLTHGWRSFESSTDQPATSEWPGQLLKLKVTDANTGSPIADEQVFLSVPGRNFQFYTAQTDSNGIAKLATDELYGREKLLIYLPDHQGKPSYEILSPFAEDHFPKDLDELYLSEAVSDDLKKLSLNMQVQNVYQKTMRQKRAVNPRYPLSFIGEPDVSYVLDAYKRFPTMEEVLREYLREIHVRKDGKDDYQLRMFYDFEGRFFNDEPLLLIDGIPVDGNTVIDFDPLEVERIEIIDNRFLSGKYVHNGVAIFRTYKGDAEAEEVNSELYETAYQGLAEKRIFYVPDYPNDSLARTPDYRNTLYWNPRIDLQNARAELSFFTGDRPGTYLIRVEGIDERGRPGVAEKLIKVVAESRVRKD